MAINFQSLRNSFITDKGNCVCLPFHRDDKLAFQIKLTGDKSDIDNLAVLAANGNAKILLRFSSNATNELIETTEQFVRISDTEAVYAIGALLAFEGVDNEQFELDVILEDDTSEIAVLHTTNIFQYTSDISFTGLISYRNNEDAFGFHYCYFEDFYNSIRVPVTLSNMQLPDEEEIYAQSDGHIRILSSITTKQYDLTTDYLCEYLHTCLKLALSSDLFLIDCEFHKGELRKNGGYQIEWIESKEERTGTALVLVNALPFDEANTLCETCESCDDLLESYGFYPTQKNNCDGTFSVRAFAQPYEGTPVSITFELLNNETILTDTISFPESTEKRDYSYEMTVGYNTFSVRITVKKGDCEEIILLSSSVCDCPTQEQLKDLITVFVSTFPPDPPRPAYISGVGLLYGTLLGEFPNIQELNVVWYYQDDESNPIYENKESIDLSFWVDTVTIQNQDESTFFYIEVICCQDAGDICETRIKITNDYNLIYE